MYYFKVNISYALKCGLTLIICLLISTLKPFCIHIVLESDYDTFLFKFMSFSMIFLEGL